MANLFILNFPTCSSSLRRVSALPSSNGAHPLSAGSGPVILELPLEKIRRPLMRTRANDPDKVKDLMDSIQEIGLQVPIDVLEVDGVYYVVIVTRLINASDFLQYAAKFAVEPKKL
ncbi:Sulfiredoxin, chloroplastic/mitochondrial [Cucurbita argyrosperma subsp. argyrosperma]|nr:Sulfiredoxin, chloroplastic/mitochondrial [Cucurbita argyrosperma subsp. argyrosperma]